MCSTYRTNQHENVTPTLPIENGNCVRALLLRRLLPVLFATELVCHTYLRVIVEGEGVAGNGIVDSLFLPKGVTHSLSQPTGKRSGIPTISRVKKESSSECRAVGNAYRQAATVAPLAHDLDSSDGVFVKVEAYARWKLNIVRD